MFSFLATDDSVGGKSKDVYHAVSKEISTLGSQLSETVKRTDAEVQ